MADEKKENKSFSLLARMKIRTKLISIITAILIVALSGMIFLASYFFKRDNKIRVEEMNLKMAEVISKKVEADFLAIVEKMYLMGTTMNQGQDYLFADQFFTNDKNLIFVGIVKRAPDGKTLIPGKSLINKDFFAANKLTLPEVLQITRTHSESLIKSYDGDPGIYNVSNSFKSPVMAVCIPYKVGNIVTSLLITYVKIDRFLPIFRRTDVTELLMVNNQGDIIAHYDTKLILSQANLINLPIVQNMMKSKHGNGKIRYTDSNNVWYLGSFYKVGFAGIGVIAVAEEDKAFEEVYRIQRRNILIMIIALAIAFLIVYFFGKSLTRPIIKLFYATKEIEKGNYEVDIKASTKDEIGELTESFIEMGKGLEEREKMKEAFGKFVNKDIAEAAMRGELKLGGERKTATVFFSDIRSFTAISEKLEPEEVVEFLNEYMTRMVNCVNNTNGVVDKFIGDAIMAVWGAPVSYGNDTVNAINGTLLMRSELMHFNKNRGGDRKPIIKIGCGLNTGPLLAGQIGSDERMEYTVIGDTVNLASRIESLNKPFGTDILISEETYKLVKDVYRVEPMQKIKVKGKAEPQQIYAVLGRLDDPESPKDIEELRAMLGIDMKGKPTGEASDEHEVKFEILDDKKTTK